MALVTTIVLEVQTSESTTQKPFYTLAGYVLKIRVKEATNIDKEIFVFQREARSGFAPNFIDEFVGVASVGELSEFDPNSPADGLAFYRSDTVELIFETVTELDEALEAIKGEVFTLQKANDVSINLK